MYYALGTTCLSTVKNLRIDMDPALGCYCDKCNTYVRVPVMSTDSSDGEYGRVSVCETCVKLMFDAFRQQQQQPLPSTLDRLAPSIRE